jgi:hypothetical protein
MVLMQQQAASVFVQLDEPDFSHAPVASRL